jgi:hypothetical protein
VAGEAADSVKHGAHNVAAGARHAASATGHAAHDAKEWTKEKAGVSCAEGCCPAEGASITTVSMRQKHCSVVHTQNFAPHSPCCTSFSAMRRSSCPFLPACHRN